MVSASASRAENTPGVQIRGCSQFSVSESRITTTCTHARVQRVFSHARKLEVVVNSPSGTTESRHPPPWSGLCFKDARAAQSIFLAGIVSVVEIGGCSQFPVWDSRMTTTSATFVFNFEVDVNLGTEEIWWRPQTVAYLDHMARSTAIVRSFRIQKTIWIHKRSMDSEKRFATWPHLAPRGTTWRHVAPRGSSGKRFVRHLGHGSSGTVLGITKTFRRSKGISGTFLTGPISWQQRVGMASP